jgi:glucan endo-1,3-alpha-glucosidase
MMGISPLQFKHIDSGQNYYRRGSQNLEYRFGQVLELQPDMIQLQTWNDAGESHYMGNSWPEPLGGSNIGTYTFGYDHTAYKEILPSFFAAWKRGDTTTAGMGPTNGKRAQGSFWHHTLLAAGSCTSDGLGKPAGVATVEDRVTVRLSPDSLPILAGCPDKHQLLAAQSEYTNPFFSPF